GRAACGGRIGRRAGRWGSPALLVRQAIGIGLFNRLFALGIGEAAREDQLDAALARFREAKVDGFFVQPSPAAAPAALAGWLAARRLVPYHRAWGKFWRGDTPPPARAPPLRGAGVAPRRSAALPPSL